MSGWLPDFMVEARQAEWEESQRRRAEREREERAPIIEAATKLVRLLDKPEPGLASWHQACEAVYQELVDAARVAEDSARERCFEAAAEWGAANPSSETPPLSDLSPGIIASKMSDPDD